MSTEERTRSSQTGSFLVRCWAEPNTAEAGADVFRAYVRNLKTGEEYWVGEPAKLGELLAREGGFDGAAGQRDEDRHATRTG